ncbi:hypothetical protein OH76DRAFT_690007 [Lentinus brumalis]|uniref:Uncharacterized protein n=1 Tax=Lentinus brumalis TaxID=2498619 RepID=A0A371D657_9APHY|nr:hypothetical protein OH76DRAFT_690007 [Polyporus brumalis]
MSRPVRSRQLPLLTQFRLSFALSSSSLGFSHASGPLAICTSPSQVIGLVAAALSHIIAFAASFTTSNAAHDPSHLTLLTRTILVIDSAAFSFVRIYSYLLPSLSLSTSPPLHPGPLLGPFCSPLPPPLIHLPMPAPRCSHLLSISFSLVVICTYL